MILDSFFRVTWKDWRLNYPEEDKVAKGSVTTGGSEGEGPLRRAILNPVVLDQVWLPDPYIFNVRSISTVRLLQKEARGVLLYSDGTVLISTL